ncbi:MAG: hypothetical protein AAGM38_04690 [Pseudomonadota bacterium]
MTVMNETPPRSAAVRSEARDYLRALRRRRLAARAPQRAAPNVGEEMRDAPALLTPPSAAASLQSSERARAMAEEASAQAADAVAGDDGANAAEEPLAEAPAHASAPAQEEREAYAAESAAGEGDAQGDEPAAPQREPASSDLAALPNIQPGLIWALSEAGAPTLEALAAADAEALRDRLGVIGQLVSLEEWIAAARASLGQTSDRAS